MSHLDKQYGIEHPDEDTGKPSNVLRTINQSWNDNTLISEDKSKELQSFLENNFALIEEDNNKEDVSYYEKPPHREKRYNDPFYSYSNLNQN